MKVAQNRRHCASELDLAHGPAPALFIIRVGFSSSRRTPEVGRMFGAKPDKNWSHIIQILRHNMFNDMLMLNKNVFYVYCRTILLTGNNWQSIFFVMCSQRTRRTVSCYTFFPIMLTLNENFGQHNMTCNIESGHVIICLYCAHSCPTSTWLASSLISLAVIEIDSKWVSHYSVYAELLHHLFFQWVCSLSVIILLT